MSFYRVSNIILNFEIRISLSNATALLLPKKFWQAVDGILMWKISSRKIHIYLKKQFLLTTLNFNFFSSYS